MGLLAIRRQGIYFAMITLALAQLVYFGALRLGDYTGGEDGLQGVPRGSYSAWSTSATTARCITSCWRSRWPASR